MKKDKNVHFLNKLVFYYSFVFLTVLVLVFGLLYFILFTNNKKESDLNNEILVYQMVKQLDRFISEMDNTAFNVMTNDKLIKKFLTLQEDTDMKNYYSLNILDSIDTHTLLANINDKVHPMRRISIYNNHGDFSSTGLIVDKNLTSTVLQTSNIKGLMDFFSINNINFLLTKPQKDIWSNYFKSNYLSLKRPIMNIYSKQVVGIVEIQQNEDILLEYLKISPDNSFCVNVYNDKGLLVISQADNNYSSVYTASSELYDWSIELFELKDIKINNQNNLLIVMLLVTFVIFLVGYLIITIIARRITKPLENFTYFVKNINILKPSKINSTNQKIYEIIELEQAFNAMLENLIFSHEQEKNSFFLAMQSQMNPHFLYNILSVINALALENKSEEVVNICDNLSSMLRYSTSYSNGCASLKDEVDNTRAYLDMMKNRYDDMFEYTMNIDESLLNIAVPKLILQPLCENCFIHGFSDVEPPYKIHIDILKLDSGWYIKVFDNGIGFLNDSAEKLINKTRNIDSDKLDHLEIGGLGIISSVVRLRLFTNNNVFCEIGTNENKDTFVCITILYL